MDKKIGLVIAGAGLLYLMTKKGAAGFYDMSGKAISNITCGQSATFDVPGYSQIWLSMLKDGQPAYDAPFSVPMQPYIYSCSNDIGVYHLECYEIDANGVKGNLITVVDFAVHPQDAIPLQ